jgi:hypothetical protein
MFGSTWLYTSRVIATVAWPEHLGDHLGVDVFGAQQCRRRVAKVVEAYLRQLSPLQERLE